MNCRHFVLVAVFVAFSFSPPLFAGKGGGHGGGGHSGGGSQGGGHLGSGGLSGHSFGHSEGHSLGHIFGHRSGGHARLGKDPGDRAHNTARPEQVAFTHSARRRRMFFHNRMFRSGFCDPLRSSWPDFLFPGDFDCFSSSFLFDQFFYGGSLNTYFWSDSLTDSGDSMGSAESLDTVENDLPASTEELGAAAPLPSDLRQRVVLLQLLDGSMYGLTRYWVEGTDLHYVTNYGGENSVPLVRIDVAKTIQLNAAQGTRFDLTRNSPNP